MNNKSKHPTQTEAKLGISLAVGCYLFWGIFPLYWDVLTGFGLGPDQVLAQRIVWCSVFALFLLAVSKQYKVFLAAITQPNVLFIFFLSALTLSVNWMTYIYGISIHRVLDTSLGYFMSPIVSILLARLFVGERINRSQLLAVILAGAGVVWLAFLSGDFPWLALILSGTWGIYSLFRKKVRLAVIPGFTLEIGRAHV